MAVRRRRMYFARAVLAVLAVALVYVLVTTRVEIHAGGLRGGSHVLGVVVLVVVGEAVGLVAAFVALIVLCVWAVNG